jgi:hypothetical protein
MSALLASSSAVSARRFSSSTLVLTGDYDPGRQVRDAHRGISGVDVLSARSSSAIGVDAQVFVLDLDFDVFVDLRINKKRSKGSVSSRRLIKRRNPNEPVNSGFRRKQPVRILAFNSERHAFQPSFLAWLIFENFSFESSLFGPLQIHSQEHLSPILRLGTTRARVNRANRVAAIVFSRQQHFRFRLAQVVFELGQQRLEFLYRTLVFFRKLEEHSLDLLFQTAAVLQ